MKLTRRWVVVGIAATFGYFGASGAGTRVRLARRATLRPLSQDLGFQGTDGRTIGCYWTIPNDTFALIFVHANYDVRQKSTIKSVYAPSSAMNNGIDPLDASGRSNPNELFRTVTWGGRDSVEIPQAKVAKKVPSLVYSDQMPVSPFKHSGGAGGALLFVRDYSSGGQSADSYDGTTKSLMNSSNYGFGGGWGNATTPNVPGHFVSPRQLAGAAGAGEFAVGMVVPHAIQAITESYCVTLLETGDSINSGVSSSDGLLSPALCAARLISAESGVQSYVVNEAISGDVSPNFMDRATLSLGFGPTVALVQCYSRNDQSTFGDSSETALATYARASTFCARCTAAGVAPILETASPLPGGVRAAGGLRAAGAESIRRSINDKVRSAGFPYVDYDRILGTGATPNTYRPDLTTDDIHPNTAGIEAIGRATANAIKASLGL